MRKYSSRLWLALFIVICLGLLVASAVIINLDVFQNYSWPIGAVLVITALLEAWIAIKPLCEQMRELGEVFKQLQLHAFTDREDELREVCRTLFLDWRCEIKPIKIVTDGETAGKTYFLLKVWKTLISYFSFCRILDLKLFSWRILFRWRQISNIVYIDCNDVSERMNKQLKKINGNSLCKNTIYLIDNLNEKFARDFILKYSLCRIIYTGNCGTQFMSKTVTLSAFDGEKTKQYYLNLTDSEKQIKERVKNKVTFKGISDIQIDDRAFDGIAAASNGNIKIISELFSTKQVEEYILKFEKKKNELMAMLDSIELYLLTGRYLDAKMKIAENEAILLSAHDAEVEFRFYTLKAHCLHLLNEYDEAIYTLLPVLSSLVPFAVQNKYLRFNQNALLQLRLAHYYKHKGNFEQAIQLLNCVGSIQAQLDKLGIYSSLYFIGKETCRNFVLLYESIQNRDDLTEQHLIKLYRFAPLYHFYTKGKIVLDEFNICKHRYEEDNNHLIANAFFIQAEMYRLEKKYGQAFKCYLTCLSYASQYHDLNLKLQVSMMINFLEDNYYSYIQKIKISKADAKIYNTEVLDYVAIMIQAKEKSMDYNYDCAMLFNKIKLGDQHKKTLLKEINRKIFVIL